MQMCCGAVTIATAVRVQGTTIPVTKYVSVTQFFGVATVQRRYAGSSCKQKPTFCRCVRLLSVSTFSIKA